MKACKVLVLSFLWLGTLGVFADSVFPQNPDPRLTQGSLCTHPDAYRYPEHIPYCRRNVGTDQKDQIIQNYNEKLGYHIDMKDRQDFKIDHLIPLCAGGSNEMDNLWPQHKSIYQITDPLEPLICEKMAEGRLLQAKAVEYVRRAKANLNEVPAIISEVQGL